MDREERKKKRRERERESRERLLFKVFSFLSCCESVSRLCSVLILFNSFFVSVREGDYGRADIVLLVYLFVCLCKKIIII